MPLGGLPLPPSTVTAQLVRDDGTCWGAVFVPPVRRNDEKTFTARH
jgi:hypothetical protein